MSNKTIIIKYLDNAIYFFFCILFFFLPISNAAIGVSLGFIFFLYLLEFILIFPLKKLFNELFLEKLSLFIIIFIISIGFSIFFSGEYIKKSFLAWFFKWLKRALLCFFTYFIFRKKSAKIVLGFLIISTFLVCINGIFQQIYGVDFIRGHKLFIVSPSIRYTPIYSTFKHYNSFAAFLVVMFFVVFGFSLNSILNFKGRTSAKAIFLFLSLLIIEYCIIFTYSRGGWLSFILILFIMLLTLFYNTRNKKLLVISFIFIGLFTLILFFKKTPALRFLSIYDIKSEGGRFGIWKAAVAMFKDSPLIGKGIGTFMDYLPKYGPRFGYQYAHNSYLQLLVETGVIGFIPFLLVIFQWLKNSIIFIKSHKEDFVFLGIFCGLCAFLIHAFFENHLFSLKLVTMFWLLLGLSSSLMKGVYSKRD